MQMSPHRRVYEGRKKNPRHGSRGSGEFKTRMIFPDTARVSAGISWLHVCSSPPFCPTLLHHHRRPRRRSRLSRSSYLPSGFSRRDKLPTLIILTSMPRAVGSPSVAFIHTCVHIKSLRKLIGLLAELFLSAITKQHLQSKHLSFFTTVCYFPGNCSVFVK